MTAPEAKTSLKGCPHCWILQQQFFKKTQSWHLMQDKHNYANY